MGLKDNKIAVGLVIGRTRRSTFDTTTPFQVWKKHPFRRPVPERGYDRGVRCEDTAEGLLRRTETLHGQRLDRAAIAPGCWPCRH